MSESVPPTWIRFGTFEVQPQTGELRKSGVRVKLHEKPLQLLLALLAHPGEIVARQELQERLWPGRTYLEFDNGLNNAVCRLRRALDDTKAPHRLVETIPQRGYRFLGGTSPAAASTSARRRRWPWVIALAATAIAGAFIVYAALLPHPGIRSLAVLPFRNRRTGSIDGPLASAVTEAVTNDLAELGAQKLVPETSVVSLERAHKPLAEIERGLRVDAVVEGTVALETRSRVRVTVTLLHAGNDRAIWAGSYERSVANVLALQAEVAQGLARAIGLKAASDPPRQLESFHKVDPRAFQAYLDGRYLERQHNANFLRARAYLEQAIRRSPGLAPAYLGLSKFYLLLAVHSLSPRKALPLAEQYAEQGLRLDPSSAVGHLRLADIEAAYWHWRAANREFRRAVALAPGLASVHLWYADYLGALGEAAPALAQAQLALKLDPLSAAAHEVLAAAAFMSGQYARSQEQCRQILLLEPGQPMGYKCMSELLLDSGQYSRSLAPINKYLAHLPADPIALTMAAVAYAHLGRKRQAGDYLAKLRQEGRRKYVPLAYIAAVLTAMGRDNAAIADLDKAYLSHDIDLVGLKTMPFFKPLAGNLRFQALVRAMHYPGPGAMESPTGRRRAADAMDPTGDAATQPKG